MAVWFKTSERQISVVYGRMAELRTGESDTVTQVTSDHQHTILTSEEDPEKCNMCCKMYNESKRLPRIQPCGHSICSMCVIVMMASGPISCPTCHTLHTTSSITQFPTNHGIIAMIRKLESVRQNQTTLALMTTSTTEEDIAAASIDSDSIMLSGMRGNKMNMLTSISMRLHYLLEDQKSNIERLLTSWDESQFQLDQYEDQLNGYKEEHFQLLDRLYVVMKKNKQALQLLQEEVTRVRALKEKDEGKHKLKELLEYLKAVETVQDAVRAINHTDHSNVETEAEHWLQMCHKLFPDIKTITTSSKVRSDTWKALAALPVCDDDQDDVTQNSATQSSAIPNSATPSNALQESTSQHSTSQDNISNDSASTENANHGSKTSTDLLEDPSLTITEKAKKLNGMSSIGVRLMRLLKAGMVYVVQHDQDHIRSARISIEKCKVYLHCLQAQLTPTQAHTMQMSEVLTILKPASTTAFLDLAWGGLTRGRVHIQLRSDTTLSTQFMRLCTGQQGHSYLNTTMLGVGGKGTPYEHVFGGDFQYNTDDGRSPLLAHVHMEYIEFDRAGIVKSVCSPDSDECAMFAITTRKCKVTWSCVFGFVVSGLEVVLAAARQNNIRHVSIVDCGVVLSL